MSAFGYTPDYLTRDGNPWFPVMGEMHYSRYPAQYWKESLRKMKAGGVNVVSTYVIWIHHEEIEGERDFSGNRDLRAFVRTCAECGLLAMLRIGPWVHGEVRNGGFPDWLLSKCPRARTNDSPYLAEVEKFYRMIFAQVEGLLHADGGPIIGVQIENEYGHCGGLSGEEGERHMRTLADMARGIGFDAPLYTATGWGGAVTGGMIPVMGGYCEAPWDQRLTDIEPSGNYIFTHERNDHNIGSDYGFGTGITFDISRFPFLTAELGGGLQVTEHRRPVATAEDIGAMSLVKLGSGVNLLGYYMYHGGTNPEGKRTTLHETKASGSINNLPELSYDFRAPVREYGQLSPTYRELKLYATFLAEFGSALCRMKADIPAENPLRPTDGESIRFSFRHDGESGYLFVNNYQRRKPLARHADVVFSSPTGTVFPPIDIEDREYFFLPFGMRVGDAVLEYALATPLCVLRADKPVYVFFAAFAQAERMLAEGDIDGMYRFRDGKQPSSAEILTLSRRDALDAWKVGERLIIERDEVLVEGDDVFALSRRAGPDVSVTTVKAVSAKSRAGEAAAYALSVPEWDGEDCFLTLEYEGFSARLYERGANGARGKLVADDFYVGPDYPWEVGLKRFGRGLAREFELEIAPLTRDTPVFLEKWPELTDGVACRLSRAFASVQVKKPRMP